MNKSGKCEDRAMLRHTGGVGDMNPVHPRGGGAWIPGDDDNPEVKISFQTEKYSRARKDL